LEINQGYTTMHGQPIIKICNAKQARQIYQYKRRRPPQEEHSNARNM